MRERENKTQHEKKTQDFYLTDKGRIILKRETLVQH